MNIYIIKSKEHKVFYDLEFSIFGGCPFKTLCENCVFYKSALVGSFNCGIKTL